VYYRFEKLTFDCFWIHSELGLEQFVKILIYFPTSDSCFPCCICMNQKDGSGRIAWNLGKY